MLIGESRETPDVLTPLLQAIYRLPTNHNLNCGLNNWYRYSFPYWNSFHIYRHSRRRYVCWKLVCMRNKFAVGKEDCEQWVQRGGRTNTRGTTSGEHRILSHQPRWSFGDLVNRNARNDYCGFDYYT